MSYRFTALLATCAAYCGIAPYLCLPPALGSVLRTEMGILSRYATPNPILQVGGWSTQGFEITQAEADSDQSSTLKLGSRGSRVTELQTLLQQIGYNVQPDGVFGNATQSAVIEFQEKVGLPTDGQVGETTWKRLQEAAGTKSPAASKITLGSEAAANLFAEAPPTEATSDESEEAVITSPDRGWLRWLIVLMTISVVAGAIFHYGKQAGLFKRRGSRRWSNHSRPAHGTSESATDVSATPVGDDDDVGGLDSRSGLGVGTTQSEVSRLSRVDITKELIKDLYTRDPGKRRKAIWELGQRGDSEAVQPMVDLMVDSDSSQRSLILAAVTEIGIRTLKPINRALLISLQDRNADVRKNAIRDVTRIYDLVSQINQLLNHAADDSDAEVRETARWALGQLNSARSTIPEVEGFPSLSVDTSKLTGDSSVSSEWFIGEDLRDRQ